MSISLAQGWALYRATGPHSEYLFIFFFSGALAVWCTLPVVQTVVLNAPLRGTFALSFAAAHACGYVVFAVVSHAISRTLSSLLLAWLQYPDPRRSFVADLVDGVDTSASVYSMIALLWTTFDLSARRHSAAIRVATTEAELAGFELESLYRRVSPDALGRALSQVQDVMQTDVQRAALLLQTLSEQLRGAFYQGLPGELGPGSTAPISPAPIEVVPIAQDSGGPWLWPRLSLKHALVALLVCFMLACITTAPLRAALRQSDAWYYSVACARTLGLWFALPITYTSVLNRPDPRRGWSRYVALHLFAAAPLFCAVMTIVEYSSAQVLARQFGASFSEQSFFVACLLIFQHASNFMFASLAFWSAAWFWGRARDEEQRSVELSAKLAATHLDALTARLEPHFLYNALNTVNALMHVDRPLAARLLAGLDQLLRSAYAGGATWTVAEERAHTARYLSFVEARFGDRVAVEWQISKTLSSLVMPRFALQHLLENVIKHNQDERGTLQIAIEEELVEQNAVFSVSDSGRGFGPRSLEHEGGLLRLQQVLKLLYGSGANLALGSSSSLGGARVVVTIPGKEPKQRSHSTVQAEWTRP